ncbi:uncharacterized protein BDW70DRAFT_135264 [Aspergillus foveolatus]|uniref:uncharacterized protein n=1 Tax=Aspergillus foveolatus TaxID=210207 RepID=UPI003CCCA153
MQSKSHISQSESARLKARRALSWFKNVGRGWVGGAKLASQRLHTVVAASCLANCQPVRADAAQQYGQSYCSRLQTMEMSSQKRTVVV